MTKELAERNAHIPSSEIERDIMDTEMEIASMELEARHLENTPLSLSTARFDHMRASARRTGIEARKKFIADLRAILEYRAVATKGNQEKSRQELAESAKGDA